MREGTMKAIGFDLGETLVFYHGTPLSWSSAYRDALDGVATRCGISPTPEQVLSATCILEHYNTRLHPRTTEVDCDEVFGRILEAWGLRGQEYLCLAIDQFFGFFQRQMDLYEDTIVILSGLRQRGVKLGVLTDVPYGMKRARVLRDLDATSNLSTLIDVFLTSGDVGYRKPEPVGYLQLAAKLGAAPHEMLFVGNEQKDIEGANRAGMVSVLIAREGETHDWGQKAQIKSLRSLFGYECIDYRLSP
jgi:putative hydrolase of the HAD superfamily